MTADYFALIRAECEHHIVLRRRNKEISINVFSSVNLVGGIKKKKQQKGSFESSSLSRSLNVCSDRRAALTDIHSNRNSLCIPVDRVSACLFNSDFIYNDGLHIDMI